MLKQRVLTAVVLLAVFLSALFFASPLVWLLLAVLVCAAGAWEWGGLAGFSSGGRVLLAVCFGLLCLALGMTTGLHRQGSVYPVMLTVCYAVSAIFWLVCAPLWLKRKWRLSGTITAVVIGLVVLLPAALALAHLRQIGGAAGLLAILLLVWTADTAAYFTGRAIGRHKLAPSISPGKTWEGAVGALVAVMALGIAIYVGTVAIAPLTLPVSLFLLALLAILTAVSIEGDLFESLLKRQAGIKDSSSLLPGHGGVLDRIDSLTSVLPLSALIATMLFFSHFAPAA